MYMTLIVILFLECLYYRYKKDEENYFVSKGVFLTFFSAWLIGVIVLLLTKGPPVKGIKLIATYVFLLPVMWSVGIFIFWKMAKKRSLLKAARGFKYIFWILLIGGGIVTYLQRNFILSIYEIF